MKDVLERQTPSLALNNASSRNRRNALFFLESHANHLGTKNRLPKGALG